MSEQDVLLFSLLRTERSVLFGRNHEIFKHSPCKLFPDSISLFMMRFLCRVVLVLQKKKILFILKRGKTNKYEKISFRR